MPQESRQKTIHMIFEHRRERKNRDLVCGLLCGVEPVLDNVFRYCRWSVEDIHVVVTDQESCASVTVTSMSTSFKDRNLLAVIGDEVTSAGFFETCSVAEKFLAA